MLTDFTGLLNKNWSYLYNHFDVLKKTKKLPAFAAGNFVNPDCAGGKPRKEERRPVPAASC